MICYLIRHGKDDETVRGGWSQHPLTDEGAQQAEELAEHIYCNMDEFLIEEIYSSDLPRAMQTAQRISNRINCPIIPTPQFREVNNGDLAGMKNDLALERYPGLFWNRLEWEQPYPNGESPRRFYERIAAAWKVLCEQMQSENKNVILVTHAGVIHVILSIIDDENYTNSKLHRKIGYAEMIAVEYQNGEWIKK